jgi:hypothetical protein
MEKSGSEEEGFYRVNLVFATSNLGRGTTNIARFDIGIPTPWRVAHYSPDGTNVGAQWLSSSGLQYSIGNLVTVFWVAGKCYEIPYPYRNKRISEQMVTWQQVIYSGNDSPGHPIWPISGRRIIGVIRLQRGNKESIPSFPWLPWRAFSGDMPETRGAVLFIERTEKLYVYNYEIDDINWWHHAEDEAKFEELKQKYQVS